MPIKPNTIIFPLNITAIVREHLKLENQEPQEPIIAVFIDDEKSATDIYNTMKQRKYWGEIKTAKETAQQSKQSKGFSRFGKLYKLNNNLFCIILTEHAWYNYVYGGRKYLIESLTTTEDEKLESAYALCFLNELKKTKDSKHTYDLANVIHSIVTNYPAHKHELRQKTTNRSAEIKPMLANPSVTTVDIELAQPALMESVNSSIETIVHQQARPKDSELPKNIIFNISTLLQSQENYQTSPLQPIGIIFYATSEEALKAKRSFKNRLANAYKQLSFADRQLAEKNLSFGNLTAANRLQGCYFLIVPISPGKKLLDEKYETGQLDETQEQIVKKTLIDLIKKPNKFVNDLLLLLQICAGNQFEIVHLHDQKPIINIKSIDQPAILLPEFATNMTDVKKKKHKQRRISSETLTTSTTTTTQKIISPTQDSITSTSVDSLHVGEIEKNPGKEEDDSVKESPAVTTFLDSTSPAEIPTRLSSSNLFDFTEAPEEEEYDMQRAITASLMDLDKSGMEQEPETSEQQKAVETTSSKKGKKNKATFDTEIKQTAKKTRVKIVESDKSPKNSPIEVDTQKRGRQLFALYQPLSPEEEEELNYYKTQKAYVPGETGFEAAKAEEAKESLPLISDRFAVMMNANQDSLHRKITQLQQSISVARVELRELDLYMPSIPRLIKLCQLPENLAETSTNDTIVQYKILQYEKLQALKESYRHLDLPTILRPQNFKSKVKIKQAYTAFVETDDAPLRASFEDAMLTYRQENYKASLKMFAALLVQCKKAAETNPKMQNNVLLVAAYVVFIAEFIINEQREIIAYEKRKTGNFEHELIKKKKGEIEKKKIYKNETVFPNLFVEMREGDYERVSKTTANKMLESGQTREYALIAHILAKVADDKQISYFISGLEKIIDEANQKVNELRSKQAVVKHFEQELTQDIEKSNSTVNFPQERSK